MPFFCVRAETTTITISETMLPDMASLSPQGFDSTRAQITEKIRPLSMEDIMPSRVTRFENSAASAGTSAPTCGR